jgi:multidrug efflux pump subunit AcrA (membrane-fusion protein)
MGQDNSIPYDPPTPFRLSRFGAMDIPTTDVEPESSLTPEQIRDMPLATLQNYRPAELARLLQQQSSTLLDTKTQLDFSRSRELSATRRLSLAVDLDRRARRAARAEQELLSNRLLNDYKERLILALRDPTQKQGLLPPARLDNAQLSLMWRDLRQQFYRVLELPVPAAGPMEELDKEQQLKDQLARLIEIYGRYKTIEQMTQASPGSEVLLSSRCAGYVFMELFIPNRLEPTWRTAFEMNLDNSKSFTAKALVLLSQQVLTLAQHKTKDSPTKLFSLLVNHLIHLKPPYL